MYCGKCGMPLAFGKSECSICGYDESHDDNNSSNNKKSNKGLIIGIIVAVILIPIIILGLIFVVGASSTANMISDSKTKSAISYYETAKKQVIMKNAMGESVICDDNCNAYFNMQTEYFEMEVEPYGNDYKLKLEFDDDFLGRDILDREICKSRDLTCTDDEVIGIISLTE